MSGMAACVKYPYVPYIEFELSTRMLKLPQRHALSQGSEPAGGVGLGENTLLAFLSLSCLLFILERLILVSASTLTVAQKELI